MVVYSVKDAAFDRPRQSAGSFSPTLAEPKQSPCTQEFQPTPILRAYLVSLKAVEEQGVEGEAGVNLEDRALYWARELDEAHIHLRNPQLGGLEMTRELLIGFQLGPELPNVHA